MKRVYAVVVLLVLISPLALPQQRIGTLDNIGTNKGVDAVRIALPLFRSSSGGDKAEQLTRVFNEVLWNDLDYSGNVIVVSRSFYPLVNISSPGDVHPDDWTKP